MQRPRRGPRNLDDAGAPERLLEPLLGRDIAPALPALEGRVERFATVLRELAGDAEQA
ncbi:MAG: hypothetical protein M5U09_21695 [Gammaproteobacteria bacterium]|nr:hypothetical protein [Gammaproteobacteria bacterium]